MHAGDYRDELVRIIDALGHLKTHIAAADALPAWLRRDSFQISEAIDKLDSTATMLALLARGKEGDEALAEQMNALDNEVDNDAFLCGFASDDAYFIDAYDRIDAALAAAGYPLAAMPAQPDPAGPESVRLPFRDVE